MLEEGGRRGGHRHRHESGLPVAGGPVELTDVDGLDVRLDIAEHLCGELGERFAPPQLLRVKVARGELGRGSGQGFHHWP